MSIPRQEQELRGLLLNGIGFPMAFGGENPKNQGRGGGATSLEIAKNDAGLQEIHTRY